LKNLMIWGYRFQDWGEVRAAGVSMAAGLAMLGFPLFMPIFGIPAVFLYMALWLHVLAARVRHVNFLQQREETINSGLNLVWVVVIVLADFVAWAKAASEVLFAKGRDRW
jgi:hypothetical protein